MNILEKNKIELSERGETYLRVRARPGAVKTELREVLSDETIKINICAPPVDGKANKELLRFLAKEFGVNNGNVSVISGAGDRIKLIKIKSL